MTSHWEHVGARSSKTTHAHSAFMVAATCFTKSGGLCLSLFPSFVRAGPIFIALFSVCLCGSVYPPKKVGFLWLVLTGALLVADEGDRYFNLMFIKRKNKWMCCHYYAIISFLIEFPKRIVYVALIQLGVYILRAFCIDFNFSL